MDRLYITASFQVRTHPNSSQSRLTIERFPKILGIISLMNILQEIFLKHLTRLLIIEQYKFGAILRGAGSAQKRLFNSPVNGSIIRDPSCTEIMSYSCILNYIFDHDSVFDCHPAICAYICCLIQVTSKIQ